MWIFWVDIKLCFYCLRFFWVPTFELPAVCTHWWVSSGDQRPWWWSVLWLHLQTGRDWGRCHCHWCAHILWQGSTSCRFNKPSWSFPEGKFLILLFRTCLLSSLANLWRDEHLLFHCPGSHCHRELLHLFNCCGNAHGACRHVRYPTLGLLTRNW